MPAGGGLNCFPATSWLGGAIATWAAPQPASISIIPPKRACRIVSPVRRNIGDTGECDMCVHADKAQWRASTGRRLTGLDPGLIERLGLVVGRIGARDRLALADANGDEFLQPLL